MNHSTEITGLRFREQIVELLRSNEKLAKGTVTFLAAMAVSMGRITGETAPFGVAMVAAVPTVGALPALLGAILGYLLAAPAPISWQYSLACTAVLLLRRLLRAVWKKQMRWHGVLCSVLAVTGAVVVPQAYGDPLVYDVLLWLTALMMAGAGTAFLQQGAALLWKNASERGQALREHTCVTSLCLTAALVLMGLCTVAVSGLSLGRVAAAIVILVAAAGAGSRFSALLGVVCGMVAGFSTGEFTLSITCFAVGGLLAGLFSPLGRLGSVAAFTICYGFFAMLAQRSAAGFLEVLLASVIFLLLPASVCRRAGILLSPRREQNIARLLTGERLEDASAALRDVASTTQEVSRRLQEAYAEDLSTLYDRVAQKHCRGCLYQMTCWQKGYSTTIDCFVHGVAAMRKNGVITPEDLGAGMARCVRRERIAKSLAEEYRGYTGREQERLHAGRVRSIVTDQFEGLAGALEGISQSLQGVIPCGESLTERIHEALSAEQTEIREVLCWRGTSGHINVRVTVPAAIEKWLQPARMTSAIAAAVGMPMAEPKKVREGPSLMLTFCELPAYRLEQGMCQIIAEEGKVCGDTLRLVKCEGGISAMVLSDGMGCGMDAALDSAMLVSLVARLLEAGLPCGSALRLVNSALMVKGGRESLATLDATEIDCYTGRAHFHKAGAAPTILRHGGRGVEIDSDSLPAGILGGVEPESRELTLAEQDIVVMISDGVPTDEEWLPALLEQWQGKDLSMLCRQIAESARLRRKEPKEDDITVAALRLVKNH